MSETNELVIVEPVNIPALFEEGGSDPIIEGLKRKAAEFEGDVSTLKGRKEIASFAAKFSTAKTKLDGYGKALSDEYRAKIAPINAERNKIKVCCDESRDQVRKPLTDYEDVEKKRVETLEKRVGYLADYYENTFLFLEDKTIAITSQVVEEALGKLKSMPIDESFEEFELAARKAKEKSLMLMESKLIVLQNSEKEKAEAERLEKERLEKEQKEREEKIAEEAAETARIETEEKARLEGVEKDRLAKEAIEKAEKETLEARLETERVEREKREEAEKAEIDKRQAIEAELNRQAEKIEADKQAEEKRQANKRHRNKIHKEAKASMLEHGISEEDATIFVTMVKDGLVKHIKIDY